MVAETVSRDILPLSRRHGALNAYYLANSASVGSITRTVLRRNGCWMGLRSISSVAAYASARAAALAMLAARACAQTLRRYGAAPAARSTALL